MIADAEQAGDMPSLKPDQLEMLKREMERAGIEFMQSAHPIVRLREIPEA